jgi:signal transduction histidine kinase
MALAVSTMASRLHGAPSEQWRGLVDEFSATDGGFELFSTADIIGRETLHALENGEVAYRQTATDETWALKQLDADHVLAFKAKKFEAQRGALEWMITLIFYAVMALVIMIWVWPLTRDLRALENSAARFGDKNWVFDTRIKPTSQIHALAETFRKMAVRIDGLIASHKDMSNAVSHEIKTPLSRMQFEIDLAQRATPDVRVTASLQNIKTDITLIDDLVRATLSYAILERADMTLNISTHNFTQLLPAIAEFVQKDARADVRICAQLSGDTDTVTCDLHLIETVVKNLLYNAARFAKREVLLTFTVRDGINRLRVDDDGPGIPEADRLRVFNSFVQLEAAATHKTGFGLGLSIVKRAVEWHDGEVSVGESPLGGASLCVQWPILRVELDQTAPDRRRVGVIR